MAVNHRAGYELALTVGVVHAHDRYSEPGRILTHWVEHRLLESLWLAVLEHGHFLYVLELNG